MIFIIKILVHFYYIFQRIEINHFLRQRKINFYHDDVKMKGRQTIEKNQLKRILRSYVKKAKKSLNI